VHDNIYRRLIVGDRQEQLTFGVWLMCLFGFAYLTPMDLGELVFQRFDNTRSGFWRPSDAASFLREIHDTNRLFVDDGAKYLARVMRRKKGKLEFDDFLEACRRFPMLM